LGDEPQPTGRWLVKQLAGAGGRGVREVSVQQSVQDSSVPGTAYSVLSTQYPESRPHSSIRHNHFLQQRIDGPSYAATFVADGKRAMFLGLTQQLVGEPEFHAKPFHYCGSIGPLPTDPKTHADLTRLGHVLAAEFGLLGLFGVDGILAGGDFWPVEINPRYPASVEVLELGLGVPTMTVHRDACTRRTIAPEAAAIGRRVSTQKGNILGKAILFSAANLVVPNLSAWLRNPLDCTGRWPVPRIADVPRAGEQFAAGQPICTLFAAEHSVDACRRALIEVARRLYSQLTYEAASSKIAAWLS
jgi:predicted ATP-grasp superfamily ATP-dependent carboligase